MRIFVIGGTGFISGRMVDLLLDRGHEVTIFTRGRSRRDFAGGPGRLVQVSGDRRDLHSLQEAVRGQTFDAVVDMIAYDGEESRVAVEAVREHTGRFVHCSTVSVYMVSEAPTSPITEDQADFPVMENWPRNPFGMNYGLFKRRCEDVLWEAHEEGAVAVTMLRPTFVSGPEDPSARDYFWIRRILDGSPLLVPGSGDHAFHQVYIDDAARAFADAVEEDATVGRAYNVAGEDVYSLNDYLRRIASILDREIELVHLDQQLFDTLPFSVHPRGDVFPFNTRRTAIFSLDQIKRDLDFTSTPFEQWMRRTVEWYLERFDGDALGYDRRDDEIKVIRMIRAGRAELSDTLGSHGT